MRNDTFRATAWDVAEKAGVSQSTVSRVMTGSTRISEKTRARVLAAAEELDYLPDKRASRLRSGLTGVIAVVVVVRVEDNVREINPFAYALLGSICRAASECDHETLVSFQANEDQFYGRYLEQRDADAMIVIGTTQNPQAWEYFKPFLAQSPRTICWGLPFEGVSSVRSENHAGGKLAANHLWTRGYRNPAFLGPISNVQHQFHERYEGFVEALRELGASPITVPDVPARDRVQQGRDSIKWLMDNNKEFDSIFAACDSIALGALEALLKAGVSVPQEVGVIGYDGIDATAHTNPPLSTIKPDLEEAGRLLVAQVLKDGDEDSGALFAPIELIPRASTKRDLTDALPIRTGLHALFLAGKKFVLDFRQGHLHWRPSKSRIFRLHSHIYPSHKTCSWRTSPSFRDSWVWCCLPLRSACQYLRKIPMRRIGLSKL